MAKQKVPHFTASVRVLVIVEVPVSGATMDEALQDAKAMKVADVLNAHTQIVDYEGQPEVISLSSDRWL